MRIAGRCVGAIGFLVALSLALAVGASAEVHFCEFGSGAGQCNNPQGVAVDPVSGDVYVVDQGNNRINVFDPAGNFLPPSFGSGGSGAAVDRDPTSLSYRDFYVVGGGVVQRFHSDRSFVCQFAANGSLAVGPGGSLYVGHDSVIDKFDPCGTPLGSSELPVGASIGSIAIDSTGSAYVLRNSQIEKYELSEPGATLLAGPLAAPNTATLATDASGHLFARQRESLIGKGFLGNLSVKEFVVITELDGALAVTSRFGYREIDFNLNGLAVAAGGGGLYGSEENAGGPSFGNKVVLIAVPPPGPLGCCLEAPSVDSTRATVQAGVNPEGKETTYHFEYVDDTGFKASGFTGPTVKETPESASIGSDYTLHPAIAQIGCPDPVTEAASGKCLNPKTVYHFRVVASNADGESKPEGEFETKQAPEIISTWSTEVGTDSAQLHATVDPLGIPTSGYFEYVDDAGFKASGFTGATKIPNAAQAPLGFGAEGAQTRFVQVTSLLPGTLYHYRIVASNPLAPVEGPERTFTTFPLPGGPHPCENDAFRGGASAALPDCRAYEMVSPVDKNGGDIAVLKSNRGFPAEVDQSATGGERFTYSSATAFGGAVSAPYSSQYTASRKAGEEWSSEPISPSRRSKSVTGNFALKLDTELKAFSADLSSGWLLHSTDPSLSLPPCKAPEGFANIYRRESGGGYEAITTAKPINQPPGGEYFPELQGLSADGTHAVFHANAQLTGTSASEAKSGGGLPIEQLYEHVSGKGCGQLRLVSVLPNGQASALSSSAGTRNDLVNEGRNNTVARAVSADGSRIFWSVATGATGVGPGALYVRIGGTKTVQITADTAQFWTAATDGSKAFYTLGEELYEFDVDKEAQALIAKKVAGVAEASEDGSRLYFVSEEALGGEGQAGKPNLYLRQGVGADATRLVATLGAVESGGDGNNFDENGFTVASVPKKRGTRTTPDGTHLAFVSSGSPTGYDNADAADGRSDLELYLYDAPTGKLACISCNPSGARPAGRKFEAAGVTIRVAAQMARTQTQLYVPRDLSDDGDRLFFESFEALVPRDGNGKADVYEWERAASQAECDAKGAELFVASAGGCLSLISSGQSPTDSVFLDASSDGHDAFFRTSASLLSQDPGLVDVYDARVGGGLPGPIVRKSPCEGEACQIPPAPPEDPTPSSSVFHGPETPKARKARCPKGKRAVRRAGKERCVAKHKRHGKRSQRPQGRAGR